MLEMFKFVSLSISNFIEKSGFLDLIQGNFDDEDLQSADLFQKSKIANLFIENSIDYIS
jgi:hypothetical protein